MSKNQADDTSVEEATHGHISPFMLSPESPETIFLLLGVTTALTSLLHSISLVHILGILILVLVANAINIILSPCALNLLARIQCSGIDSETCHKVAEARLADSGRQFLAWISGVTSEDKLLDSDGSLSREAGQSFLTRAGNVGAAASFALIYKFVSIIYSTAYRHALVKSLVTEFETAPAHCASVEQQQQPRAIDHFSHSNPLICPNNAGLLVRTSSTLTGNPLKEPDVEEKEDVHKSCCTACEALETAQVQLIETVRQYDEANDTVLVENDGLRAQVIKLHIDLSDLRAEIRAQDDRIEYLEVLLEEAGRQTGHGGDV